MRIITGKYRGRRLFVPTGLDIRPTADRVKEAVFSILGDAVVGAVVLDLFAGAGSLGLEALSRGAESCLFVDQSERSLAVVKRNVEMLGARDQVQYRRVDVIRSPRLLAGLGPFDLIFLDPPYGRGDVARSLRSLSEFHLAGPGALVVAEHEPLGLETFVDPAWKVLSHRKYGQTCITIFEPAA